MPMHDIKQNLSRATVSALKAFLGNPDRPDGTLSYFELQGFLFTIASSPETIPPSEWLPMISNDENFLFEDETEAQQVRDCLRDPAKAEIPASWKDFIARGVNISPLQKQLNSLSSINKLFES